MSGTDEVDTQPTLGFQRVIQRAMMHVQSHRQQQEGSHRRERAGRDLRREGFAAVYYLHQQGITRLDVVNYISHGITKNQRRQQKATEAWNESAGAKDRRKDSAARPVHAEPERLANQGKIDPLIGREAEVERVIQVLCRRRKNNPLLVGEAGVGKTAIAEGLAWRIVQKDVPEILQKPSCISLDMGALSPAPSIAATSSSASRRVLKQLKDTPNAILFIDEIHTHHRRRLGVGRHAGRVQPAQAGAGERPAEVHRRDHVHGVPRHLREGLTRCRAASRRST